jgi:hypothetical protein
MFNVAFHFSSVSKCFATHQFSISYVASPAPAIDPQAGACRSPGVRLSVSYTFSLRCPQEIVSIDILYFLCEAFFWPSHHQREFVVELGAVGLRCRVASLAEVAANA